MRRANFEEDWQDVAAAWRLRPDTIYLNHGSFGPPPAPVRAARRAWQDALDEQPMDFFVRQFEPAWFDARRRLATFVNCVADDMIFVENATAGMNLVADGFRLGAGDEVLLTDHEYGAVERIWRRAADAVGAKLAIARLPLPISSVGEVLEAIFSRVTVQTRLLIVSHITSPTAIILPVEAICREARSRDLPVCIDGPHALLQTPVDLRRLGCDFYTASCHKWLCAPFGTGFLYVSPQFQPWMRPAAMSWGRTPPTKLERWFDEFVWSGTRDPSAFLAIPAAVDFFNSLGFESVRERMYVMAGEARTGLLDLLQCQPYAPATSDGHAWYGSMTHLPLPPGDARALQHSLWQNYGIEVPIVSWRDERSIRVSCHLYNTRQHLERLLEALRALL
ncbi:MAG: aminotransferase class V-fold PLP-dependent enzyme [Planctomycetales bacterium]|nr:aminotransferase class V-fold PLP-dependent enzyme [Planctomycetales bacterium]